MHKHGSEYSTCVNSDLTTTKCSRDRYSSLFTDEGSKNKKTKITRLENVPCEAGFEPRPPASPLDLQSHLEESHLVFQMKLQVSEVFIFQIQSISTVAVAGAPAESCKGTEKSLTILWDRRRANLSYDLVPW
jgi:hypothetical protein